MCKYIKFENDYVRDICAQKNVQFGRHLDTKESIWVQENAKNKGKVKSRQPSVHMVEDKKKTPITKEKVRNASLMELRDPTTKSPLNLYVRDAIEWVRGSMNVV